MLRRSWRRQSRGCDPRAKGAVDSGAGHCRHLAAVRQRRPSRIDHAALHRATAGLAAWGRSRLALPERPGERVDRAILTDVDDAGSDGWPRSVRAATEVEPLGAPQGTGGPRLGGGLGDRRAALAARSAPSGTLQPQRFRESGARRAAGSATIGLEAFATEVLSGSIPAAEVCAVAAAWAGGLVHRRTDWARRAGQLRCRCPRPGDRRVHRRGPTPARVAGDPAGGTILAHRPFQAEPGARRGGRIEAAARSQARRSQLPGADPALSRARSPRSPRAS